MTWSDDLACNVAFYTLMDATRNSVAASAAKAPNPVGVSLTVGGITSSCVSTLVVLSNSSGKGRGTIRATF
jgi:hypothetical protein